MQIALLETRGDRQIIDELRALLADAEDALLCSAFVSHAGIHLLREQLGDLGSRARLLTTTIFGSTQPSALNAALDMKLDVRVLNPRGGCYHPKLYVARNKNSAAAMLGSANLTSGLVANEEIAALFRGNIDDVEIAEAWRIAERLWSDARAEPWSRANDPEPEVFRPEVLAQIRELAKNPVFLTLGTRAENVVTDVRPHGLYVETARSKSTRGRSELVPSWMIELAYDYLVQHGELSNKHLLNELRVHRSSFVCALLARFPGVRVYPGLVLRYEGAPVPVDYSRQGAPLLAADRRRGKKPR